MTPGLYLCAAMLRDNDVETVRRAGVTARRLTGPEAEVFDFILQHHEAFGAVPARDTLAESLSPETVEMLPDAPPEPLQFYIERVNTRALSTLAVSTIKRAEEALNRDPASAIEVFREAAETARKGAARTGGVTNIKEEAEYRFAQYRERHATGGKIETFGLDLPWPSMNECQLGLVDGTTTVVAGRIWSGKTWLLLALLFHVWSVRRKSPLVISMEMSGLPIGRRLDALYAEVPYTDVLKGTLVYDDEQDYGAIVQEYKDMPDLFCIRPPMVRTVEDLRAVIREYKPDGGVWIDGLNRLRAGTDTDRFRRVMEAADETKFLAEEMSVPVVATTHFGKQGGKSAQKGSSADIEDIGYALAIGEQSDNIWAIVSTEELKQEKKRLVKRLKTREEADQIPGFFINFDHDLMDFSEVGPWDGEKLADDESVPF
jgi:replicative DNA helicase